jgi:peptide/nickel transport system substrate-binding protein
MDSKIDHIKEQLMSGKITRRDFGQRLIALGIVGSSAGTLLTWAEQAHAAKSGGRLRSGCAHGSTTDSLDPATYDSNFMIGLDYGIHNHLGEVDHTGAISPELLESWEPSNNAKTWVINLRRGVEFHNGKTLDSDDVIASFQHHMGETKSPAKSLLKQITSMRTDGKNRVIFDLEGGNADFMFVASDYHVPIKPSKGGKISPTDGIGTGPYVLKKFEPGVRAFFTRHPNYFKSGRAHFDEVEMLAIIDPTARTNALTTGEVDTIDRVDLKTAHLLARKSGVRLEEVTGTKHYTFPMRTDTSPFDDNNVRMALKHAVNREEIVEKILFGHGVVGNDHPIAPSNPFHAATLPQRQYDPDQARFYAKKAGGISVQLSAADAAFAGAVDAAVLYKEHAAAAGIEIEVIREPNDGYWKNVWMKKPWGACYWGGRPTEDWMFTTAYMGGADWNDTFWKHDRFDKLLIWARAETNQAKRREMYYAMQEIVRDEGGVVIPMFANYVLAMTDKVKHGTLAGNWDMDGQKFMERWWFA